METAIEDSIIIAKLDSGMDIFKGIKELVKDYELTSATVLNGIGMIKNFELSYFDSIERKYKTTKFTAPHELISLHGTVVKQNNDILIHLHTTVADPNYKVYGGHLARAEVHIGIELLMLKFNTVRLRRIYNPATTLMELSIATQK